MINIVKKDLVEIKIDAYFILTAIKEKILKEHKIYIDGKCPIDFDISQGGNVNGALIKFSKIRDDNVDPLVETEQIYCEKERQHYGTTR